MKISISIIGILLLTAQGLRGQTEGNENQDAIIPFPPNFQADTVDLNLPDWLTILYPDTVQTPDQTLRQEITDFRILNDSVSYVIYDQMSEVCTKSFIGLIINKRELDQLGIGEYCDHDLSIPFYKWKHFELQPTNKLLTFEITESFHDSLVEQNGRMKIEYHYFEAEKSVDTTTHVYLILQSGEIRMIK